MSSSRGVGVADFTKAQLKIIAFDLANAKEERAITSEERVTILSSQKELDSSSKKELVERVKSLNVDKKKWSHFLYVMAVA